jgi:hypothetical protein
MRKNTSEKFNVLKGAEPQYMNGICPIVIEGYLYAAQTTHCFKICKE